MVNTVNNIEAALFEKDAEFIHILDSNANFLDAVSSDLVGIYTVLETGDTKLAYQLIAGLKTAVDKMKDATEHYSRTIAKTQITPVASDLIH